MLTEAYQIEQNGNLAVVTVAERELTTLGMQELVNELMLRMRNDNAQFFVFDLTAVRFISSGCLGSLVAFLQDLEHVRGRIGLVGCRPDVLFLFKITRLDTVFRIYDDLETAAVEIRGR